MNDMLDALLAALPDSAFFAQRIGDDLREKLRAEDIPFAGYLRGAAVWDLVIHPAYPVYSIAKTNTEDNEGLHNGFGTGVFSSVETGELLTFPMIEESGKMPLAARAKPARAPSDLPYAKTYSVDDAWRSLPRDFLCGGYGTYEAFLRAGNFQSRPYRFKAVPDPHKPHPRPYETVLKSKGIPGKAGSEIIGAGFSASADASFPAEPGMTLVQGKVHAEHGVRHFPVHGAFRFMGMWPKEFERMPIHFLVTERNVRDVDVNTLWIPREKIHFQDGAYTGSFDFDLGDLFIAPADGKSKPPKEAWISAVHRGWQGPIMKVDLTQLP